MLKNLVISFSLITLMALGCSTLSGRSPAANDQPSPFERKYGDGETLNYRIQMTHTYDGTITSTYDAHAAGIVKSDDKDFYEKFHWTSVIGDGNKITLSPAADNFRQVLSLVPPFRLSIPAELTNLGSSLIGPITDLLTFYADESLIIRHPNIRHPSDHLYLNASVASSWGSGQDCLDFEITLLSLDQLKHLGMIKVSHLPPSKICIKPPAKWMESQVIDTPNNWYDIDRSKKKWVASAGKETPLFQERCRTS